uniref:Secreted protein n=1 Tax=Fundulus heteroclitus TaxID=8078 RepID=A0A3Q2QLT7_FUNHE
MLRSLLLYWGNVLLFSGISEAALGVGHGPASPVVILHRHVEGYQTGPLGAQSGQQVLASPLEVVLAAVKGAVVRVTRGRATGVADGPAGALSVDYGALLVGGAGCLAARHHAQGGVALTQATATLVGPELLARLVIAALI